MRRKGRAAVWIFLLLTGTALRLFPQPFIQTDAAEGVFSGDQRLTFTLSQPGWLRLLLDNREIYRGRGPAYPELGLPSGEERGFSLNAEYYSPENILLESRYWHIYIDKKPPVLPDMEFRDTGKGYRLVLSAREENVKIRAYADMEGELVFFPDLNECEEPPADSFQAVVWAEDLAGNCSEPRAVAFEIPPLKIENPVPGEWINPQMLIISGAEGRSVYWTADGTNPLEPGGTGRLYRGPERINSAGWITLRVARMDSSRRPRENKVVYAVTGPLNGDDGSDLSLDVFRKAEEKAIRTSLALSVPDACRWSLGGAFYHDGGESVTLRPERLIRRTAALHFTGRDGSGGVYRFAYLLDGTASDANPRIPVSSSTDAFPVYPESPRLAEQAIVPPPLDSVFAGRSRVILWPRAQGTVYYSWGGAWQEGRAPLPIPLEGGTLQWFTANGERGSEEWKEEPVSGPYSVTIAPLPGGKEERLRGRIACRPYNENTGWHLVSDLLDYAQGMVRNRPFDVCDGEDLQWAFISSAGKILEQGRRDRRAPGAPELSAPAEGTWNRGPVRVSIAGGGDTTGFITARLRYASGTVEVLGGTGVLDIACSLGEAAEVTVEGFLSDSSGNRGPRVIRNFIIDPRTIFVSPRPLVTGSLAAVRGDMGNPFASLEEALDFALKQDSGDINIQLAGTLEPRGPIAVSRNTRVNGFDNSAVLVLGDGFYWNISPGVNFTLSGVRADRKKGDYPLFRAGKNGKLEISGSVLTHTGPLLIMDGGTCEIRDSQISTKTSGEQRIAAFSARNSRVHISGSRVQLEGNYGLVFDLGGGSFSAAESVFLCAGLRSATVFVLNGTRGNLENLTLSAAARDYASVLEASGSELVLSGGTLGVSARDTNAVLLDHSASVFLNALIRVESSFAARALEIRGLFPSVQNCRFYAIGGARVSEVFSGMEGAVPLPGSVTGNRFFGFTHIRRGLPAGRAEFD